MVIVHLERKAGYLVMNQNQIISFIWGIADDCLRDVYVRGKYRDVILPMTVIRRLDAVLEETKDEVLAMKKMLDEAGILEQTSALCNASGEAFYNCSPFILKDLRSRAKAQQLKADFIAYLDGFSPNVQEILEKFKFRNQIDTMTDAGILGAVIEKFVDPRFNLSPKPVLDDKGDVDLPGLDNHTMGVIFEELILVIFWVISIIRGTSISGLSSVCPEIRRVTLAISTARSAIRSRSVIILMAVVITRRSRAIGCCRARRLIQQSSISSIKSSMASSPSTTFWANSSSRCLSDFTA
jgi:hypothetical protein